MALRLSSALQGESVVYLTTYGADGRAGTVPVWFVYSDGKVYFSTGRESVKGRRMQADPRVRMAFGRRDGPALDGTACFCEEQALLRRIVPLLNRKYDDYYGPNEEVVHGLLHGSSVLVEVTPCP